MPNYGSRGVTLDHQDRWTIWISSMCPYRQKMSLMERIKFESSTVVQVTLRTIVYRYACVIAALLQPVDDIVQTLSCRRRWRWWRWSLKTPLWCDGGDDVWKARLGFQPSSLPSCKIQIQIMTSKNNMRFHWLLFNREIKWKLKLFLQKEFYFAFCFA